MQKILSSIIISMGLILSANIISNKNNEIGRYQLFQGQSKEAIFYEMNGVISGDNADQNIILKIDTKTGEVSKYEVYIIYCSPLRHRLC